MRRSIVTVMVVSAGLVGACATPPTRAPASHPQFSPPAGLRVLEEGPAQQCAPYARAVSGVAIYGDASTWWSAAAGRYPRSASPAAGAVMVLRGYLDPARGHVAVVRAEISAREILVDHANWLNRGEVITSAPVRDVSPDNDWSQVRVWHPPSGTWGARIYSVEGFIHPLMATS